MYTLGMCRVCILGFFHTKIKIRQVNNKMKMKAIIPIFDQLEERWNFNQDMFHLKYFKFIIYLKITKTKKLLFALLTC